LPAAKNNFVRFARHLFVARDVDSYATSASARHDAEYLAFNEQALSEIDRAEPLHFGAGVARIDVSGRQRQLKPRFRPVAALASGAAENLMDDHWWDQPATITGLDIAENMLAKAKLRLGGSGPYRFLHYDGITVPLPDASLDFVYSVAALQHVPKPYVYNLFFEIRRLLKPAGFAVLHLLSFKHLPEQEQHSPWRHEVRRQIGRDTGHWHHFYSRTELENVLQVGTGFSSVDIRENGSIWACVHQQALPTQGTEKAP